MLVGELFFNEPAYTKDDDADNGRTRFGSEFGVAEGIAQACENANQNDQQPENL